MLSLCIITSHQGAPAFKVPAVVCFSELAVCQDSKVFKVTASERFVSHGNRQTSACWCM